MLLNALSSTRELVYHDEVGIPMLLIEFDAGDVRMTSLNKFKEILALFPQTNLQIYFSKGESNDWFFVSK